ncbi:hypothetical protein WH50_13810 [Pokkaliibacter plantistimulans]|uniref:Thermostable hemolysin n=1 Tax=Pokkaliibacter plantistimulans TaxID=1635171 RepID=A0ABX5LWZ2_9GAMM|nr:thermostable hemolysin [Pokkaliibacter plantistimulans]PXF30674.1 hypothetical protein WH50_13810 [Pokkaliibacter plantistimulans]
MAIPSTLRIDECHSGDCGYPLLQDFIARRYRDEHRATVRHFLPVLFGLHIDGQLQAAVGIHGAGRQPLFLEQYLDEPIEQALSAALQQPVRREDVVEVGNLATLVAGGGRWLILLITRQLHHLGWRYVVFTGTPQLYNGFRRLGLSPLRLAEADPERLGHARHDWGSYYDNRPQVMAGSINLGYDSLSQSPLLSRQLLDLPWPQRCGGIALPMEG